MLFPFHFQLMAFSAADVCRRADADHPLQRSTGGINRATGACAHACAPARGVACLRAWDEARIVQRQACRRAYMLVQLLEGRTRHAWGAYRGTATCDRWPCPPSAMGYDMPALPPLLNTRCPLLCRVTLPLRVFASSQTLTVKTSTLNKGGRVSLRSRRRRW